MIEIRITGLSLSSEMTDGGRHPVLARFACIIGPLSFRGCALKLRSGEIIASLPACKHAASRSEIIDRDFRADLADAALKAFHALGGVVPPSEDDTE